MVASSWIYRRHYLVFKQFPWILATLACSWLPVHVRREVADLFMSKHLCCLDVYFGKRLRLRVAHIAELLDIRKWPSVLLKWAMLVSLSIQFVEFLHAQNRRFATSSTHWGTFTANFVNREALVAGDNLFPTS